MTSSSSSEHKYITIKDYLSTPQGNIKQITFKNENTEEGLRITYLTTQYYNPKHADMHPIIKMPNYDDNDNSLMPVVMPSWLHDSRNILVNADRDNHIIKMKFVGDLEKSMPLTQEFPYTTNETVFET